MFRAYFLLLLFSFFVCGQTHIPKEMQTENNDLRTMDTLFVIKSLKNLQQSFKISIVNNAQNILSTLKGDNQWRIATSGSEKIDTKFVSDFIKMKYSMKKREDIPCSKLYELEMRGETQVICDDEINKIKIIKKLIMNLEILKNE